jgi:hypothetical protein
VASAGAAAAHVLAWPYTAAVLPTTAVYRQLAERGPAQDAGVTRTRTFIQKNSSKIPLIVTRKGGKVLQALLARIYGA